MARASWPLPPLQRSPGARHRGSARGRVVLPSSRERIVGATPPTQAAVCILMAVALVLVWTRPRSSNGFVVAEGAVAGVHLVHARTARGRVRWAACSRVGCIRAARWRWTASGAAVVAGGVLVVVAFDKVAKTGRLAATSNCCSWWVVLRLAGSMLNLLMACLPGWRSRLLRVFVPSSPDKRAKARKASEQRRSFQF